MDELEIQSGVEAHRQKIVEKITFEAEPLVDELLFIIYNREVNEDGEPIVDAKIKLSAIAMLLDRGIPKLGVDHTKKEVVEESITRKKIREEIETLVKGSGKQVELGPGFSAG